MTRTRFDNEAPVDIEVVHTVLNTGSGGGPPPAPNVDWTGVYNPKLKSITDVVTPGYEREIKRGAIINNPMILSDFAESPSSGLLTFDSYKNSDGSLAWSSKYEGALIERYLSTPPAVAGALDRPWTQDGMMESCRLKALANIDPTPYAFAEDVAELRETFRYLWTNVTRVRKLSDRFMRKEKRLQRKHNRDRGYNSSKFSEDVANLYLEYRFAISPLIRSVADIMEAYNALPENRPDRLTSRGFESRSWDSSRSLFYGGYLIEIVQQQTNVEDFTAGILYTVSNPAQGFRFKYGLRNKDIPVTMWAIVPYSFMVDRVLNLSLAAKAVTNLVDPNVQILAGWERQKVTTNDLYSLNWSYVGQDLGSPGNTAHLRAHASPHTVKQFTYNRSTWVPSAVDAIPPTNWENLANNFLKVADILALASQLVMKGKK